MTDLVRITMLFRPAWRWMALAAALAILTVAANVALLATSGWFITAMGLAGLAGAAINYFTPAAMIRAFAIARTAGRYGDRVIGHEAALRLVARLRVWLFERLEPLAPFGATAFRSTDLMSRLRGDLERLEMLFLRIASPLVVAAVTGLVSVVMIALWHRGLALAVFGLLVMAGVVVPVLAARRADPPGRRIAEASAELNTALGDVVAGLADLEAYGATQQALRRVDTRSEEIIDAGRTLASVLGAGQAVVGLAASCAMLAALLLLPSALSTGLAGAELVMLALFAWAAFESIGPLPAAVHALGVTQASARRVLSIVDAPPPVAEPAAARPLPPDRTLEFSQVSLCYPGTDRLALEGIDLTLRPGRHIGVVGASGSGKSSLVHLASRLVAPTGGRITLGGIDVAELYTDDVRSIIAVAAQTVHIFTGTIADNLRIARADATAGHLEAACRIAQLHDFVAAQPAGYDTFVGAAGLKLSGGQVRRLAVARALLKDAPILLLDEPTEGLDDVTGRALLRDVCGACRDRSLLVISHRTAGLECLDELIFLQAGHIAKRGAPHTILTK